MPTILQKCQTLFKADLVRLIDRALETQSTKTIEEYLRQLEINLEALEKSAETVAGSVRTLKHKYDEYSKHADTLDRDIDRLILRGKDDLAAYTQEPLNNKFELAQEYYEQWKAQEEKYDDMVSLNSRMKERIIFVRQLESELQIVFEDNQTIDIARFYNHANIEKEKFEQYLAERKKRTASKIERIELNLEERKRRLLGDDNKTENK